MIRNIGSTQANWASSSVNIMLWVGTVVPAFLMTVLGYIAFTQFVSSEEDYQWVEHTYEVIIDSRKIEKQMVDLETGQRGFIITGREKFLEPFEVAKKSIFSEIEFLRQKTRDNAPQTARLNSLDLLISRWLQKAGVPEIEARQQFDRGEITFESVSDMLIGEGGKIIVDDARALLLEFIAVEEALIQKRKQKAIDEIRSSEYILAFGVAFATFISLLSGWFTSRNILNADWVKSKQTEIVKKLQGTDKIEGFSNSLLSTLMPVVSAQAGSVFCVGPRGGDKLYRVGTYGMSSLNASLESVEKGQGLVGQCFAEGKEIRVVDIPESYFDIESSLGKAKPKEILLVPVKHENAVVAVIELATFSKLSEKSHSLLLMLSESLGVMVSNISTSEKTKSLLTEVKVIEERSSGIIDSSIDTIITIDHVGTVLSFNLAGEKLFGYQAEEVIGQNVKILMPNPYQDEHDGYLKQYSDTGEKKIIGIGRGVEAKKKNGMTFPMDLSVSEIRLAGKTIFSGTIRDITERKEAESNLQQANAELEEFAYRTSHDLRSPIVSSVRLLDMTMNHLVEQDQDMALQCLSHAQSSLTKLNVLIGDILVLTEAKNKAEEDREIDIAALISDAITKMEHMENFDRLDIQKDLRFDGVLCSKEIRVNMVLENLISNAIKYQDTNRLSSYIKISTFKSGDEFVLEIEDNGLGIPEDQQDELFTMFRRFHPKTAFGSGLGLYLMKKSADVLNGKVSFQNLQEGSIFRLSIPV